MFEVINPPTPDLMEIRISGKVGEDEYARLQPWLKRRLGGRPSLLVVMDDFRGWPVDGARAAVHQDEVRQVALVGDDDWRKLVPRMAAPFDSADVRYFARDRIDDARVWLGTTHKASAGRDRFP